MAHPHAVIIKDRVIFLKDVIFENSVTFNQDVTIATAITNRDGDVLVSTVPFEPPINFISVFEDGVKLLLAQRPVINMVAVLAPLSSSLDVPIRPSTVVRIINGTTQNITLNPINRLLAPRKTIRITVDASGNIAHAIE